MKEADSHCCCMTGTTGLDGGKVVGYLNEPLEGFEDAAEEGSC